MTAPSSLALYLSLRGALVNYANGIVGDRAQAEDVVQEAYIRFAAADAAPIAHPASYLYRIVRNVALDWVRRPSTEPLSALPHRAEEMPHDAPTAERVVLYRDELRVLSEALAELPERTRRAFTLYRLEGQTLQQVADRLGISVVRAHQLVKEALLHGARRLEGLDD
ncbi:sigma-70 family RNA polymerase sigma factor [Reyranella sp.]|uniref:sigma-70 family RNA polymerase sigma factor n=1 Tax=Reyranella sp. TaxID=1929291 RepID=UPI003BA99587